MEQYIPKSALVAEIERWIKIYKEEIEKYSPFKVYDIIGKKEECNDLLSFINTLEVKEVQEPTAADRGMAEEIIINLKRVEQDYHIDLTREMEWLRNLMKKGE